MAAVTGHFEIHSISDEQTRRVPGGPDESWALPRTQWLASLTIGEDVAQSMVDQRNGISPIRTNQKAARFQIVV